MKSSSLKPAMLRLLDCYGDQEIVLDQQLEFRRSAWTAHLDVLMLVELFIPGGGSFCDQYLRTNYEHNYIS